MAKEKTFGELLVESAEEAVAIKEGHLKGQITVRELNVKEVRTGLELTQAEFSKLMGVSSKTVEAWERGSRNPSGSAAILMLIAQDKPELVKQYA